MKAWLSMMPVTGDSKAPVHAQVRFDRDRLGSGEHAHARHPVHLGAALDAGQHRVLLGIGRDDELAAVRVRHALLGAIGVERLATRDAEPCHEAAGRVIDAGVDHLAVARGCLGADAFRGIQNDHVAAGQREGARHRQPDDAGSHHDAVHPLHTSPPRQPRAGLRWPSDRR